MSESMNCPIEWCSGYRDEHGGEGDGPESWLHMEHTMPLTGLVRAHRWQEGAGPVRWSMLIGNHAVDADNADELVRQLHESAEALSAWSQHVAPRGM